MLESWRGSDLASSAVFLIPFSCSRRSSRSLSFCTFCSRHLFQCSRHAESTAVECIRWAERVADGGESIAELVVVAVIVVVGVMGMGDDVDVEVVGFVAVDLLFIMAE